MNKLDHLKTLLEQAKRDTKEVIFIADDESMIQLKYRYLAFDDVLDMIESLESNDD